VGLELGQLSLVITTEELLVRSSGRSVQFARGLRPISLFHYVVVDEHAVFKTIKGNENKRETKRERTKHPLSCRMKLVESCTSDVTAVNWTRT
jgi:hypothetical protein